MVARKLVVEHSVVDARIDSDDLLTPKELAARLKVNVSWVFEQTRERAKTRAKKGKRPLPCIRPTKKLLRFYWPDVCEWLKRKAEQ